MATKSDVIEKGLKAGLSLAAEAEWDELTLAEIAEAAGLSLSDFHKVATKDTLVDAAEGWFDKSMSAETADMEDGPQERLFDVIMLRFEAMEPYRAGMTALMKYRERSPARLAALLKARSESARWALVCAGLDTASGAPLSLKTLAIAWVIGQTERSWRKDEDADFARTMATLDKELKGAEDRMGWVSRMTGRSKAGDAARDESATDDAPSDEDAKSDA
jgi:AcrR family transcriptional regulator